MAGLVANVSLIAGVAGDGMGSHAIVLTGIAGLTAGAFAMASGEFVAVSSHNEVVRTKARRRGLELLFHPEAEEQELAEMFHSRGFPAELADTVAKQVSADPEQALAIHLREEFGVDHRQLPSPLTAAATALATFAAGAVIPLLPYLLGYASLAAALTLAALAALVGGELVARRTGRPLRYDALRQPMLGTAAAGITYLIGHLAAANLR